MKALLKKKKWKCTVTAIFLLLFGQCTDRFLGVKPDKSLVVPTTLNDFEALMANTFVLNNENTSLGEIGADNVYVNDANFNAIQSLTTRNAYIWGDDVLNDGDYNQWALAYRAVLQANIVLDGLEDIDRTSQNAPQWDRLKGTALFFRAQRFFDLSQNFAMPYDSGSSVDLLGIPLRLSSDLNERSVRSTLEETYQRVLLDMKMAVDLLPVSASFNTDPNKAAAYAMLARVYLSMREYAEAGRFADLSLQLENKLMDYNELDYSIPNPVLQNNEEMLIHLVGAAAVIFSQSGTITKELYDSYAENDLRKKAFFNVLNNGNIQYRGSYSHISMLSSGPTTAEMMLVSAESKARAGDVKEALILLNTLLEKRYEKERFELLAPNDVLAEILSQRRKELVNRCLRWTDLRRLNFEAVYQQTITKIVNGQTYQLTPGSKAYAYKLPLQVIEMTGMEQNP